MRVTGPRGVLAPGETVQLQAVETDSFGSFVGNRSNESIWSSSSPDVATVSAFGLVTGLGVGATDISVAYRTLTGLSVVRVVANHADINGRIDPAAAADIIAYNQDVKKFNTWRETGTITRWELPVSVYVDPSVDRTKVELALKAWRDLAGLTYRFIDQDAGTRIVVRSNSADPMGSIDNTNIDNSACLASVYIPTHSAFTVALYQHELGHALGALDHIPGSLMAVHGPLVISGRETRFFAELYQLPHGAHVEPDGTWTVR
jgi:hypothetical protein